MLKLSNLVLLGLAFLLTSTVYAENTEQSPVGLWKTIDDVTGKPKAIVEIWQDKNKTLQGRILRIFSQAEQHKVCKACEGERHNQPVVGMIILENLKQNKEAANQWTDGKILDPKTGKIYNAKLEATDEGRKLNVRGFIGVPLFGRTQTWIKVHELA